MSKKIIVGNWKMNPGSLKVAEKLFKGVSKSLTGIKKIKVVVCVPSVYIKSLKKYSKKLALGGQDAFWEDTGAYTGEISSEMLYEMGARYVILGHSERRAMGENNEQVNKKLKSAIKSGLTPVLCVGETERDKEHEYFSVIKSQLEESISGISKSSISKLIIAYEPVWAISTTKDRKNATAADSLEMSIFLRKVLVDMFGKVASSIPIIYGGSANEKNAEDFLVNGGVDGLLPGKASLNIEKFSKIISITERIK